MPISSAIKKYGKHNFHIEIIKFCETQAELDQQEIFYVKLYNTFAPNGYNLRAGNGRGALSDETKRKIGLANKGKKRSAETKRRLSESHMGFKVSESTKAKLSKINKGKKPPEHVRIAAIRRNEKSYFVTDPNGRKFSVTNMKKFCKEFNLSPSKMCLVAKGMRNHHKNYIVSYNPKGGEYQG